MVRRYSPARHNTFYGCSTYPECHGTRDIGDTGAPGGARRPAGGTDVVAHRAAGASGATPAARALGAGLLRRLVKFYDASLLEEGLRDLRFRTTDASPSFVSVSLDLAALLAGNPMEVDSQGGVLEWVSARRVGSTGSRFYMGFPLLITGNPVEVAPLLYVSVELEHRPGSLALSVVDAPQLNYRILEDAGLSTDEAIEVSGGIEARMREASEQSGAQALEAGIREIVSTAGLDLGSGLSLKDAGALDLRAAHHGRVQNAAILFASDRLGYTQSTRRELATLAEAEAAWDGTALGAILSGNTPVVVGDAPEIIMVSPLSEAQRKAVASALTNPVTVVTGPPGTGKSELVLNLVANGLSRGETVMVASRNNKAVDVVVERFRGLTDEASLVRVGRSAYRNAAIALMKKVVNGIRPPTETEVARATAGLASVREARSRLAAAAAARAEADARCDVAELAWEQASSGLGEGDIQLARVSAESITPDDLSSLTALRSNVEARASGKRGVVERFVAVVQPKRPLRSTRGAALTAAAQRPWAFAGAEIANSDWHGLVAVARRAEAVAIAASAWKVLADAIAVADSGPSLEALGEGLLDLGASEAAAGRRHVAVERQKALSDLPQKDEQKLNEYLRAVDQLGGSERLGSRMYGKLKALESTLFTDVQRVFPVWALTTLTARSNLPLRAGLFDLLIVDEASQCDLPSALPLLARARRVVVIGDDKQLIHVTTLRAETEQALAAECDLTPEELINYSYRKVSLFTLARHLVSALPTMTLLDEHYRSHPQIIGFSNERFYGSRLNVFTEPERLVVPTDSENPAVRWEDTPGHTVRPTSGSAFNEAEVERVVQVVARFVSSGSHALSIGVVTPFRIQKERITNALAHRFDGPTLERHQVSVDTAHGFQGDERDVIVFSTVISSGALPGTVQFVDGNPNIFNVAVTRARSLLVIVGDEGVCMARDGLLGELARYAARLKADEIPSPDQEPDTDDERLLLEHLIAAGFRAVPQLEVRGLRVDIGLPDEPRPVAVEVDGSSHDSPDGSRLLRDVYRDTKLRRAGWLVARVPSWRVRLEPDSVVAGIRALRSDTNEGPDV